MKNNEMKCDNCGREEVNFHYTSNINGKVTEKHLCSECAAKLGYADDMFIDTDRVFENMLSGFFGGRSLLRPWGGFGLGLPTMTMPRLRLPRVEIKLDDGSCGCGGSCECEEHAEKKAAQPGTDAEAVRRRELNALNEQMRRYAQDEEFEKAAEIRDRIRKMQAEGGAEE